MGLEKICERCGNPSKVWHHDMYGPMCRACKKSDAPPSERQKKSLEKFLRDNEK